MVDLMGHTLDEGLKLKESKPESSVKDMQEAPILYPCPKASIGRIQVDS